MGECFQAPERPTLLRHPGFLVAIRLLLGGFFLLTGTLKLLEPPEEFALVLESYQLLPEAWILPVARILPWVELVVGGCFTLGLYTRLAGWGMAVLLTGFTLALGWTLVAGIPLEDCGCFGSLGFQQTGSEAFVRNVLLLGALGWYLWHPSLAWTLDRWLSGSSEETI